MLDKLFVTRLEDSVNKFSVNLYDAPEDRSEERSERSNERGGQGTHLPYGLCKKYGINLPETATPRQAWSALKKMGVTPEETYKSLSETGTVENVNSNKQIQEKLANAKESLKELKALGMDVSEMENMTDDELIQYYQLDEVVTDSHFDELDKSTQKKLVETNQEQYIDSLRYSKQRKDNAVWFTGENGRQESYDHFKPKCWEVWKHLNDEQKDAIHGYTDNGYYKINRQLRGLSEEKEYVKEQIELIDSVLDRSVIREDCWLQRGVEADGAEKFLNIESLGYTSLSQISDPDELIGLRPVEKGYMSCGSSRGTGMNETVTFNIFVPKGTHGMYLAPVSEYGGGSGGKYKTWNGESTSIGAENETLLHRGLKFEVTKVEKNEYGNWFIDMEVILGDE